jgi:hypothetical protein
LGDSQAIRWWGRLRRPHADFCIARNAVTSIIAIQSVELDDFRRSQPLSAAPFGLSLRRDEREHRSALPLVAAVGQVRA